MCTTIATHTVSVYIESGELKIMKKHMKYNQTFILVNQFG